MQKAPLISEGEREREIATKIHFVKKIFTAACIICLFPSNSICGGFFSLRIYGGSFSLISFCIRKYSVFLCLKELLKKIYEFQKKNFRALNKSESKSSFKISFCEKIGFKLTKSNFYQKRFICLKFDYQLVSLFVCMDRFTISRLR